VVVPAGVDRRGIAVLSTGHVASDMFQGALPALLPFLREDRGYSYTQLTTLVLLASLASAFLQPLLGILADRVRSGWMMPAGLVVAGAGFGASGVAESYAVTATALFVGGLGVAAFHPEAIRFASRVSGARKGTGMSLFALGGSAGFALGPAVVTVAASLLGLAGTAVVGVLIGGIGIVALAQLPYLERYRHGDPGVAPVAPGPSDWTRFGFATTAAVTRGITGVGLSVFIPLFVVDALDHSKQVANVAVTVFFLAALVGTLAGGQLADRLGFDRVVVTALVAAVPPAFLLPVAGIEGVFAVAVVLGFLGGTYFYPLVVVAQQAAPAHHGLAAGMVLGMSIGLGSVVAALLGLFADAHGTTAAIWVLAAVGSLSLPAALGLSRTTSSLPRRTADATSEMGTAGEGARS
jgi:FSR family fosmidomycin resistance protein-like MFS transporter